jgi:hypothetical protein
MSIEVDSPRNAKRKRWLALAVVFVGVVLGIFVLFFLLANDAWVVINVPNAPWDPEPGWAAFEARLAAVMAASFVVGAVAAVLLYRLLGGEDRRRSRRDRARIEELEGELKNVSRLLASSRDKS